MSVPQICVDANAIPGIDMVEILVSYLITLVKGRDSRLSNHQADHIVTLHQNLDEFDKKPFDTQQRPPKRKPLTGRFCRRKDDDPAATNAAR